MKNISFFMTPEQVKDGTKTVTRRNGWKGLKVDTILRGVLKGQGLGKGGKVETLCIIRVVGVRREPLNLITQADCVAEGFPNLSPGEFVEMYWKHMKVEHDSLVTRIEFEYVDTYSKVEQVGLQKNVAQIVGRMEGISWVTLAHDGKWCGWMHKPVIKGGRWHVVDIYPSFLGDITDSVLGGIVDGADLCPTAELWKDGPWETGYVNS